MAGFPTVGLDIKYELALNSTWVDVSGDVYQRMDTQMSRGQADESSSSIPQPSQCSFQLDNRAGNYSSRNPVGAYYGQLGRNTPLQISLRTSYDTFTRTVVNGWGFADSGEGWSFTGSGGTPVTSDIQVNGSAATHSVPLVLASRWTLMATRLYDAVDVACSWSMALASITGGNVEPCNLIVGYDTPTTGLYWMARVQVAPGGAISVGINHYDGYVVAAPVASGLTYVAGTKYRVRMRMERRSFRAKIWLASGTEPYAWLTIGTDTSIHSGVNAIGAVGVRSGIGTSNSNTLPIIFTYDDFEVRSMRFTGEIPEWPASIDVSGQDKYISVTASDPLRRLNSGAPPLRSSMFRGTMAATPAPQHYWPCEDGTAAANATNIVSPAYPFIVSGSPQWASFSGFACSAPLPALNGSLWTVYPPGYADTGSVQIRFLMRLTAGEIPNGTTIMHWSTNGSLNFWRFIYRSSGNLELVGYDQGGAIVVDNFTAFLTDDKMLRVDINFVQSGANLNWQYSTLAPVLGASGAYVSGTATGQKHGIITSIMVNPGLAMKASVVGHIMVNTTVLDLFSQLNQLNAYASEDAVARIQRLCQEEGVDIGLSVGKFASTLEPMGPQTADTLLTLLGQCVDVDMGMLMGARSYLGLLYVRRSALTHADAVLTASYSAHEFQPPFAPITDDQRLHNDVTVNRTNGGSFRTMQTTGALSTAAPPAGAGTYPTSKSVSAQQDYQLGVIGGWLLAKGTVDSERYSGVVLSRQANEVVANATLSQALLNVAPGDKVAFTGMTKLGLYDTAEQTINQVTETINRFRHDITLTTVPEKIFHAAVLDVAAHRLDSDSSTTNGTLTTTATSMSVATTSGPAVLWTTNGAHFPFDVMVSGERMTVINCTGATSPQTMTVTRSVNGVVKSHVVGEAVILFDTRYVQI